MTTAKLDYNAVTSAKIADGSRRRPPILPTYAVTSAKILNRTIICTDIADGAINNTILADGSVDSYKILDNSILCSDIRDGTITSAHLASLGCTRSTSTTSR